MIVRLLNHDGTEDEYDAQEVEISFFDCVELTTDYRQSLVVKESAGERAMREAQSQEGKP